jgi:RNA polymerase sigma factor (sigma-70 family)
MLDSMDTAPSLPADAERIEQLKQMNGLAWAELLNRYGTTLHRDTIASLRRRGLSPDLADDVVQETWMTAVRKIGEYVYTGEDKLYHWLRAIAFNHVRNLGRAQRQTVSFDEFDDNAEAGPNLDYFLFANALVDDSVEDEVLLREQLAGLDQTMQSLRPQERELLVRALVWRETPEQLAQVYGIKPRTISQILWRAKQRIQSLSERHPGQ